jgi:hypothetical protein
MCRAANFAIAERATLHGRGPPGPDRCRSGLPHHRRCRHATDPNPSGSGRRRCRGIDAARHPHAQAAVLGPSIRCRAPCTEPQPSSCGCRCRPARRHHPPNPPRRPSSWIGAAALIMCRGAARAAVPAGKLPPGLSGRTRGKWGLGLEIVVREADWGADGIGGKRAWFFFGRGGGGHNQWTGISSYDQRCRWR